MVKRSNEEKSKDPKQEEQERLEAKKRLLEKGKKVPHPGTVRVTIFPNPRGRRFVIDKGVYDNKNH